MAGGLYDVIGTQAATYRQQILFNLEKDNPTLTAALIPILLNVLPPQWRERTTLTAMPEKSGLLEEKHFKELKAWIMANLYTVEAQYSKYLYVHKQSISVLQVAVHGYRSTLLFYLQRERNPITAKGLLKIMNVCLPEAARVNLMEPPIKDGLESLSWKREEQIRKWIADNLTTVEANLSKWTYAVMFQAGH